MNDKAFSMCCLEVDFQSIKRYFGRFKMVFVWFEKSNSVFLKVGTINSQISLSLSWAGNIKTKVPFVAALC